MLAAALYGRAAEEALRLHGETFACTYLTVQRAASLYGQSHVEGVDPDEAAALQNETHVVVSSCLSHLTRRMDDNTMLPGRGTAVELDFNKRFIKSSHVA